MAEIKIRKKRPFWPWIVLIVILIVALVCYLMVSGNRITEDNMHGIGATEQREHVAGPNDNGRTHANNEVVLFQKIWA